MTSHSIVSAHGLRWSGDGSLPFDWVGDGGEADVAIARGAVPTEPDSAARVGALLAATRDEAWLTVPGVARFHVAHGRRITVDAEKSADEEQVNGVLVSSAMGLALHQRSLTALHASAIASDDRAVAVLSATGAGRSTLAWQLAGCGMTFLGDDMARVDADSLLLYPAENEARLWPRSLAWSRQVVDDIPRVFPGHEKRRVRVGTDSSRQPARLVGIVLVASNRLGSSELPELSEAGRLALLRHHTWRRRMVPVTRSVEIHVDALSTVAREVPMVRLHRHPNDEAFDRTLVDALGAIRQWLN